MGKWFLLYRIFLFQIENNNSGILFEKIKSNKEVYKAGLKPKKTFIYFRTWKASGHIAQLLHFRYPRRMMNKYTTRVHQCVWMLKHLIFGVRNEKLMFTKSQIIYHTRRSRGLLYKKLCDFLYKMFCGLLYKNKALYSI